MAISEKQRQHLARLHAKNALGHTRKGRVRSDGVPVSASFGEIARECGYNSDRAARAAFLSACEKVRRGMARHGLSAEQVLMALRDEPMQPLEPATDMLPRHLQ